MQIPNYTPYYLVITTYADQARPYYIYRDEKAETNGIKPSLRINQPISGRPETENILFLPFYAAFTNTAVTWISITILSYVEGILKWLYKLSLQWLFLGWNQRVTSYQMSAVHLKKWAGMNYIYLHWNLA